MNFEIIFNIFWRAALLTATGFMIYVTVLSWESWESPGVSVETNCLNGVEYYTNDHYMTPALNQDGTLRICE